jgi:hypothetical protein
MNLFQNRKINTLGNFLVGTTWQFRGCQVTMHSDGFFCNCKKRLTYKCNHIKSVELGILGVGQQYHK